MAEQLSRYWDARGSRHARSDTLADALDPALTETIEQLYAHDDAELPDPSFLTRLETTLMNTFPVSLSLPTITAPAPLMPDGRADSSPRTPWPRVEPRASERPRGLLASLATAALVILVLAGSFFAFGPRRPGRQDDAQAILPVVIATPATPSAGPVEFLWETRGDPVSPLGNPSHLAIAPDGSIWVADADNDRFQIFAPDGTFLEAWGTSGSGEGEFDFHTVGWGGHDEAAIAFAPDGTFYVADPGNHRIQKFGPDRDFLTAWGSEGQEPRQFDTPIDLVVDGQGRVYVLDSFRNTAVGADPETGAVQVFDADGRFLAEWGERGTEPGQMNSPFGIGLDPDGTLLIAEFGGNRVQRFTPEGEVLDGWGGYGNDDGQFAYAMDAAVDAEGRVFVTDYGNNRVQVFDHDGRFLAAWGKFGSNAGQFGSALGVAVGGDGTVYVTDANKRLQAFRVGDLPVAGSATPAATEAVAGTPSG
jgi:DNA-binding beta-propeller fold protein YncE/cbb3-type cytochrome oxidase subunit 3